MQKEHVVQLGYALDSSGEELRVAVDSIACGAFGLPGVLTALGRAWAAIRAARVVVGAYAREFPATPSADDEEDEKPAPKPARPRKPRQQVEAVPPRAAATGELDDDVEGADGLTDKERAEGKTREEVAAQLGEVAL